MHDRRFLLWGIPVLAGLALLPRGILEATSLKLVLYSWAYSLVVTTVLWLGNRALWQAMFRRLPRVDQSGRRQWQLALSSLLYTAVAATLLLFGLSWLGHFRMSPRNLLVEISIDLIPTLIILLIYESTNFFRQWEANLRRADQLAHAATQAQLDALHGQLDPHFLFNNLNTLAALIEPGNAPAQQFVEQLADVCRYVLLAQGRPTVPLAEELAFVETYLALHKVRFRENLVVETAIAPAALARCVAPLSVQLLVENALKHNVASRQHPLHLHLTVAAENPAVLRVENTLRPRPAGPAPGTGTGLANVRRRYELLHAAQPVEVVAADGRFLVKLPLLYPAQP